MIMEKEKISFEEYKNKYFIEKSLIKDVYGFRKDLSVRELFRKYKKEITSSHK